MNDKTSEKSILEDSLEEIIVPKTRNAILNDGKRIFIDDTSRLKGSISLKGARFDDIILRDYKEKVSKDSSLVTILSPKETVNPYFAC